jgi:DNA-3-methyladenine glycosylase II
MQKKHFKHSARHRSYLIKADPVLKEIIEANVLAPRELRGKPFPSLARAIIGQQLSVKAAQSIYKKILTTFKSNAFPSPEKLLAMPKTKLRKAGLSNSKVEYLRNLATFVGSHAKDFRNLERMSDQEITNLLIRIKGVGIWTAEMFLMFCLGREDVFSYGDYGLKVAMRKIYGLRKIPSAARAKQISDKWKPYRTHASLYLWQSLNNQ